MNLFKNKRCPRCNTKMPVEIVSCPSCQLNFQKFETATNAEAKQAIREGEKDRVLMRKGRPSDVSAVKLILITIFLGFTGAHYYYVGRYKMGAFFSIFFAVGIVNAILNSLLDATPTGDLYQVFTLLVLVWGVVIALWIIDVAKVCFNKFKIPVSRN
ncbi:MAG: hypothetical protein IJ415_04040 [Clostridia bacterium]|nr:hypothetical protein [Clostridia bacterium]